MALQQQEKIPYPLFERQFTLFLRSDDRNNGNAFDFNILIPNLGYPTSDKCVIQIFQVTSNRFNPIDAGGVALSHVYIRSNLPQSTSYDSQLKTNSDILIIASTDGGEMNFNAYDKTFFSFRTFNPYGRQANFRLTNENGIPLNQINGANNPANCKYNLAINVFFD